MFDKFSTMLVDCLNKMTVILRYYIPFEYKRKMTRWCKSDYIVLRNTISVLEVSKDQHIGVSAF